MKQARTAMLCVNVEAVTDETSQNCCAVRKFRGSNRENKTELLRCA
jgi:hypothetical protein